MSGYVSGPRRNASSSQAPARNPNQGPDPPWLAKAVWWIRERNLFDESFYALRAAAAAAGIDPVLHYLKVGEPAGVRPSARFDPTYYGERYPDVGATKDSRLLHFSTIGHTQGRRPVPLAADYMFPDSGLDRSRNTVLLLVHKASRSGAPILAWNISRRLAERYNVVAVLLSAGELTTAFQDVAAAVVAPRSEQPMSWDSVEASYMARALVAKYAPKFAIANSALTQALVPDLALAFVPVVALVHEFGSRTRRKALHPLYQSASVVVFPASLVARSSQNACRILQARETVVLPQGRSVVPRSVESGGNGAGSLEIDSQLRSVQAEGAFLVVGIGSVAMRKGVDAFLAAAAEVKRLSPRQPVRFVWIGPGFNPSIGTYSLLLLEQIERSGLQDVVALVDAVDDLEPVYEAADLLFLSSRLDPLPNVAIDAALEGLPVVCFENASGMAEILGADDVLRQLVVPYLDCAAAARAILALVENDDRRKALAARIRSLAEKTFDMDRYVDAIMKLGEKTLPLADQQKKDLTLIEGSKVFDPEVDMGTGSPTLRRATALRHYLVQSSLLGVRKDPIPGIAITRPAAGFHPLIYARECPNFPASTLEDPFAHYVRTGLPEGPWKHSVIGPDTEAGTDRPPLRVALHGHFHYPELLPDLLALLSGADFRCDLLITTTGEEKYRQIEQAAAGYDRGSFEVRTVPNRGRDIGALLSGFPDRPWQSYDVLGHLHGKRSPHIKIRGDSWREFLWQNLVGANGRMAGVILSRFAEPKLGLVFPENPKLIGWDKNLAAAENLAPRLGLAQPLPMHIDFPVGTMFWARPEALAPLFDLGLTWDDYPEEPLPSDGTMLHAIERLLPLVARQAGYRFATTNVPGVGR